MWLDSCTKQIHFTCGKSVPASAPIGGNTMQTSGDMSKWNQNYNLEIQRIEMKLLPCDMPRRLLSPLKQTKKKKSQNRGDRRRSKSDRVKIVYATGNLGQPRSSLSLLHSGQSSDESHIRKYKGRNKASNWVLWGGRLRACYSVSSVFHNSNTTTLGTVYCVGIHLFMICGYVSPWHDVSSGCRWRTGLPDMEGRCKHTE